jgi:hypothetical protein
MDSAEKQREKPCYGLLRCWSNIQAVCPVYMECFAKAGGIRMNERHKMERENRLFIGS